MHLFQSHAQVIGLLLFFMMESLYVCGTPSRASGSNY
uniref:Uncharacterized protein n=1 Tax=Parascaris equorum TaxID=6256 RepID=A0A914RZZ4_PAREQ